MSIERNSGDSSTTSDRIIDIPCIIGCIGSDMDGELIEIDSRPSDAIALAVTAHVPIYVSEDVMGEACGDL